MGKLDMRDGSLVGRMMGVVGASWKGISYIRKHVIPNNPDTVAQQGVRTTFASLVAFGKRINSTVLKDFILPVPKRKSQFNEFISRNQAMLTAGTFDYATLAIGDGGLYTPDDIAGVDNAINGVDVTWGTGLQGEALATDTVIIVIYDETSDSYAFSTTVARSVGTATIPIVLTAGDKVHCYGFFIQGSTLSSVTTYSTFLVT